MYQPTESYKARTAPSCSSLLYLLILTCYAACSTEHDTATTAVHSQSLNEVVGEECPSSPAGQSIQAFANECAAVIGVEVPDFHCDNGTEVPQTHLNPGTAAYPFQYCDRPNVLYGECDPGSRFQVLPNGGHPNVLMVAHCRKRGAAVGQYKDIAVIQHNKDNGATCFYQALGQHLSEDVKKPSSAINWGWLSPAEVAEGGGDHSGACVSCHDSGPFIRSEYINQLRSDPAAQAAGNYLPDWVNSSESMPYRFVGDAFQTWKVYKIQTTGSGKACASACHRMGLASVSGHFNTAIWPDNSVGTSLHFSIIATADSRHWDATSNDWLPAPPDAQLHKNEHSADSPIWMRPTGANYPLYTASVADEAMDVAHCAQSLGLYMNSIQDPNIPDLPPPPCNCQMVEYGQGIKCHGGTIRIVVNGAKQGTIGNLIDGDCGGVDPPCPAGDCPLGLRYWTSIHGPFWQSSPITEPYGSEVGQRIQPNANYIGSFLVLHANGVWSWLPYHNDGAGPARPYPGGTVGGIRYQDLAGIPGTAPSGFFFTSLDADGMTLSSSSALPDNIEQGIEPLTGFIGNVAQSNVGPDSLRIDESGMIPKLAQSHTVPVAPLSSGPLRGEAYTSTYDMAWGAVPYVINANNGLPAKNIYATHDTQLVDAAQSLKAVCFISGLEGAWSSTRMNGTLQPYAIIYTGMNGDIRINVWPDDQQQDADRVAAYASCILKK